MTNNQHRVTPDPETAAQRLSKRVFEGAAKKNLDMSNATLDRIAVELAYFKDHDLCDKLLVLQQLAALCRLQEILRAPAVSLEAQSLVCYCLDLCLTNPLERLTYFELLTAGMERTHWEFGFKVAQNQRQQLIAAYCEAYPGAAIFPVVHCYPDDEFEFCENLYVVLETPIPNSDFMKVDGVTCLALATDEALPKGAHYVRLMESAALARIHYMIKKELDDQHPYDRVFEDGCTLFGAVNNADYKVSIPIDTSIINSIDINDWDTLTLLIALSGPTMCQHIPYFKSEVWQFQELGFFHKRLDNLVKPSMWFLIYEETFIAIANQLADMSIPDCIDWLYRLKENPNGETVDAFMAAFALRSSFYSHLGKRDVHIYRRHVQKFAGSGVLLSTSYSEALMAMWGLYYHSEASSDFEDAIKLFPTSPTQPSE